MPSEQIATERYSDLHSRRLLVFIGLCCSQILVISYAFNFPVGLSEWANPVAYAKKLAQLMALTSVAFGIIVRSRWDTIVQDWTATSLARRWHLPLLVNLCIFALVLTATILFSRHAADAAEPPWPLYSVYCAGLMANGLSLAWVAAPAKFWKRLLGHAPLEALLAVSCGLAILLASALALESWRPLSAATLVVAKGILSLYETNVVVDWEQQVLGVDPFHVYILAECSGYEGIALVLGFFAIYLWMFRAELRFPNALLILPLGIVAIWLLNAVRIAALISIGAHVSPAIAMGGFHSQAGWIGFLLVTVGFMALSHRVDFFRPQSLTAVPVSQNPHHRLLLALLVPFMCLMGASIIAQAFAPHDRWLYPLKVAAVAGALWWYKDVYVSFASKISLYSVLAGACVGVAWIATDPGGDNALGAWLSSLPLWLAALWLGLRIFGSIVLVPIAEELAFRGYLHRVIISRSFETVSPGQWTWLALIATSLLFGLMHQRWIAAALAGAVYAAVMYRSGRMADPIAAHMASNAVIVVWALFAGQWALL
ncbi:MAG: exosortase E/protease, VPEID-CTERM system [Rhodospirillales bacterium]|nr:exosortase E/protease, VPEID-CTERM system [Rhodospirillales bacterium]